ncbi:hypothetical protein V8D89_004887, partial [Ganoderma adspersum]
SSSTEEKKLSTEVVTVEYAAPPESVDHNKVLRKLDLRLIPPVCFLYLFCFLDRANITNAKVAGMTTDLNITGVQFNLCVAVTLIPYSILQAPSNIALKKIGPARWLPMIMFIWGSVLVSMAFSGLLPGLTYYLCAWYPKFAQAKRIGFMLSGVSLAGAFGGLLAFVIQDGMHGVGGLPGWSWIFLLEGLATVVIAVILLLYMYDYPENATFLTDAERAWLLETIRQDNAAGSKKFKKEFIIQAIRDPKTYLYISIFFLGAIPGVSFTTFLPTIINGMGFSSTRAQILTIPPNATACILTLCITYLSDKRHIRGPFILVWCPVAMVGYVMLIVTKTSACQFAGAILVMAGLVPCGALHLSWAGGNFSGELKRAVVIGMIVGFGNFGGQVIIASFVYRQQDSPRYTLGHKVAVSSLCLSYTMVAVGVVTFRRMNKRKIAQCEREGLTEADEDAFAEMGDRSPLYR